jgi:hypothetical protein
MSERYKECARCGSEFVLRVESCLDCGGPLTEVDPRMATAGSSPAEAPPPAEVDEPALGRGDEPTLVCREPLQDVRELASLLDDAGIRCDLLAPEPGDAQKRYSLFAAAADLPAAREIQRRYFATLVPEAASLVDLDVDGCPACGTPRAAGAVECPECGLTIGFAPEELEAMGGDDEDDEAARS